MITITPQTTARQIADQYAHPMGENIRAVLADAIEKFAAFKLDRTQQYMSHVSNTFNGSNNLHNAIRQLIKNLDRMLIESARLEEYKSNVLFAIEVLNKAHPRCTPIAAKWRSPQSVGDQQDWQLALDGPSIAYLALLAVDNSKGATIVLPVASELRKEITHEK